MGGCGNKQKLNKGDEGIFQSIRWSLDTNCLDVIPYYLQLLSNSPKPDNLIIDEAILEFSSMRIPILGYTLCKNQLKQFKYLYEKLNADPLLMEKSFNTYNQTGLDIICDNQYINFLDYYLPIFEEIELGLDPISKNLTTVQKLAENGNLEFVSKIFKYFEDKSFIPICVDFKYVHEKTGENVALCACRSGNFNLIKFLYERCRLDFHVVNKKGENGLSVILRSGHSEKVYWNCFKYIRNVIGIEIQDCLVDDEKKLLEKILGC